MMYAMIPLSSTVQSQVSGPGPECIIMLRSQRHVDYMNNTSCGVPWPHDRGKTHVSYRASMCARSTCAPRQCAIEKHTFRIQPSALCS